MRSILRQLAINYGAQTTTHRRVVDEYERREIEARADGFDVPKLCLQDCIALILTIVVSDPVTIVVDAIDELEPNSRYELVKALGQIVKNSANVVKIFVTSRDDAQILALLPDALVLRIHPDDNSDDMKRFVRERVTLAKSSRLLLEGDISCQLEASLEQALIDCAGEW